MPLDPIIHLTKSKPTHIPFLIAISLLLLSNYLNVAITFKREGNFNKLILEILSTEEIVHITSLESHFYNEGEYRVAID